MIKQLILYSTSHCHLCESAQALLAAYDQTFTIHIIDIAEHEAQLAQYGTRIPVLHRADNKKELCWPFDAIKLHDFLFATDLPP